MVVRGSPKELVVLLLLLDQCPVWNEPNSDGTSQINIESSIANDIIVNGIYINGCPEAIINSCFGACESFIQFNITRGSKSPLSIKKKMKFTKVL